MLGFPCGGTDEISEKQKLSEDFIREFKNKVNWGYILREQNLSRSFIKEFKDEETGLFPGMSR